MPRVPRSCLLRVLCGGMSVEVTLGVPLAAAAAEPVVPSLRHSVCKATVPVAVQKRQRQRHSNISPPGLFASMLCPSL